MNDIKQNAAKCWCSRLNKLMKERNYTQRTFLKEYKEKYGGGVDGYV